MTTANGNVPSRNKAAAFTLSDGLTPFRDGVIALGLAGAGLLARDGAASDAIVWTADQMEAQLATIEDGVEKARRDERPIDVDAAMDALRGGISAARLVAAGLHPSGKGETDVSDALTWILDSIAGGLDRLGQELRSLSSNEAEVASASHE